MLLRKLGDQKFTTPIHAVARNLRYIFCSHTTVVHYVTAPAPPPFAKREESGNNNQVNSSYAKPAGKWEIVLSLKDSHFLLSGPTSYIDLRVKCYGT